MDVKSITINDLLGEVSDYSLSDQKMILKAYNMAKTLHSNQVRCSGEPYIIHPLNVSYTLAKMRADTDTICAGLLHDTLEDTNITKEEIRENFNSEVANLVDGVTKIRGPKTSKEESNLAYTRKILTGLSSDARIIIIKLADKLHNMQTLEFKPKEKQKKTAIETLEIFAPLAYYIGAYRIREELEDLSLYYMLNDEYKKMNDLRDKISCERNEIVLEMMQKIKSLLDDKNIPNDVKLCVKNLYGIYKTKVQNGDVTDMHDLLSIKIMVDEIANCYQALGLIHSVYRPLNGSFKDFIYNPKMNMYRSLHTTVFAPDNRIIQSRIRTFDMDEVASYGLTRYWNNKDDSVRERMQTELYQKSGLMKTLDDIDTTFKDDHDFVNQIKSELFSENVYVYTPNGEVISLPLGSSAIDFAYKIHSDIADHLYKVYINDEEKSPFYILKNNDRVRIVTDKMIMGPDISWLDHVVTATAKRKIKEYHRKGA